MLKSILTAERIAMAFMILVSAVVGRQIAVGMSDAQLVSAVAAVLGSCMAVVMVRMWPAPERVPVKARRERQDD